MKEIIKYIKSHQRKVSILNVYIWCEENNKTQELKEYQELIIELVKEYNNYIEKKDLNK